jgi:class 3 adenylate cyclase
MPALVVQHSGMARQQVDTARDLAARIPDARLVVLEGLMRDDTQQIVRAISELLGSTLAAPPEPAGAHPHSHETGATVRTILFTDIVGHTTMMQRLGDRAGREVLREHENLTRDVLKKFSGIEVKTMGDGFMASFASVTAAVECAVALQRAFATHNESAPEPIVVRVGLDAGEPIEEAGDFFGSTVIMAARIASEAGAGEILASEVVRGLCAGKGFLFADRGEYLMRGFEEPSRLCEVGWRQ